MEKEIKVWLIDIHNAILEINSFLPEKRNYFEFQNDLKTKRAIERSLEIIGEAVNRILKLQSDFPIENARKIVDTRNRIIHGYDTISDAIIWAIVTKDLPKLLPEVKKFLDD